MKLISISSSRLRTSGAFRCVHNTINHEIFVVKIFSDSTGNAKIKRMKILCIINTNAVRGCLSENLSHEIFVIYGSNSV